MKTRLLWQYKHHFCVGSFMGDFHASFMISSRFVRGFAMMDSRVEHVNGYLRARDQTSGYIRWNTMVSNRPTINLDHPKVTCDPELIQRAYELPESRSKHLLDSIIPLPCVLHVWFFLFMHYSWWEMLWKHLTEVIISSGWAKPWKVVGSSHLVRIFRNP